MAETNFDNRMAIFRFLDEEFPDDYPTQEQYVLASDKYITGHMTLCSPSGKERLSLHLWQSEKDKNGLYKYLVKISYGFNLSKPERAIAEKQEKLKDFHEDRDLSKPLIKVNGYRFHGGQIDEICCLLSLFFQARFYLLFKFDDAMKYDYDWSFVQIKSTANPNIFNKDESTTNNFNNNFEPFLNKIKLIKPIFHQDIAFAAYLYKEALHTIGINKNIVLTHLVSAIEALTDKERNKVILQKLKGKINKDVEFSKEEKDMVYNAVGNSGVKKAFIKFVIDNSKSWPGFKSEADQEWFLKIRNENKGIYSLPEVLERIYNSRSKYLHEGSPTFIDSTNLNDGQHFSPAVGAIIDNTSYLEEDKLPYIYIFEDLVRFSILNFIDSLSVSQTEKQKD